MSDEEQRLEPQIFQTSRDCDRGCGYGLGYGYGRGYGCDCAGYAGAGDWDFDTGFFCLSTDCGTGIAGGLGPGIDCARGFAHESGVGGLC